MAFESGWIEREEDEKYVATKGFKNIFGEDEYEYAQGKIYKKTEDILSVFIPIKKSFDSNNTLPNQ